MHSICRVLYYLQLRASAAQRVWDVSPEDTCSQQTPYNSYKVETTQGSINSEMDKYIMIVQIVRNIEKYPTLAPYNT